MNKNEFIDKYVTQLSDFIINKRTDDEITDLLIDLGKKNIFIPTIIMFMKKHKRHYELIRILIDYINAAYTPGLRAQILDDFIRERLKIENKINEIKSSNGIYSMEQKLGLYKQAESMLYNDFTTATTHSLMKIFNFRTEE